MRVYFEPPGCIPLSEIIENARLSKLRGLSEPSGKGLRLALVGGGPSAAEHLDVLRAWDGEVWAINGAWAWCRDHGIAATFVTFHPMVDVPAGVVRAVIGEECSPALFDALAGCELYTLTDESPNGQALPRGGTTATAVAVKMPLLGFYDLTFFGLEGSYGARTHNYAVYQDPDEPWMVVKVGGETFQTKLEFLTQSIILAELVHAYPIYEERCGGLLGALVRDHEYDVIEMAPILHECSEIIHGSAA